jgi:nucleotide-binding universal stress UspA family protein
MTTDVSLRERPDRESGDTTPVVLALVEESSRAGATLGLACLVAQQRKARLELVYILLVPRSLAMEDPFEEAEGAAARALAAAQQVATQQGLSAGTSIYRARSAPRALLLAAEAHHPDVVVVASEAGPADGEWCPVVAELAQRLSCEVVMDRLPTGPRAGHDGAGNQLS